MNEARDDGVKRGIEQAKLEFAKKFKEKGVDIIIISESTGLSVEEIQKL